MELLHARCAGLDVHKDSVVAAVRCVSVPTAHEVRTFGTTSRELLELNAWLAAHGCTHAVLEATGVYWKPVWHLLADDFELCLANAHDVRNVPGRKTDVKDAVWLAELLAHGLVRSSFVPPTPIQELRDLTRTRRQLVREVGQHSQRVQKVLESANIKLGSVLSDVLGTSGRTILAAMIAGESDPARLAALAQGTARRRQAELVEALHGRVTPHHRRMLRLHLQVVDSLQATLAELDADLGKALEPFADQVERLQTVPGFGRVVTQSLVAEIGVEMHRFPTSANLVSWAGLCPRHDESAGKRRSTRTRKSGTWLKPMLITAAWAAVRRKDTYLAAQFQRIRGRRGAKKAIVAVAASMLTAAYHILRDEVCYQDLGADYFDRRNRPKAVSRMVRRLHALGYEVHLRDMDQAS